MKVIAAAQMRDGLIFSLPAPNRHHNIIAAMIRAGLDPRQAEQGFLLDDGRFATRKAAAHVAREAGQIRGGILIGGTLTTEDLW